MDQDLELPLSSRPSYLSLLSYSTNDFTVHVCCNGVVVYLGFVPSLGPFIGLRMVVTCRFLLFCVSLLWLTVSFSCSLVQLFYLCRFLPTTQTVVSSCLGPMVVKVGDGTICWTYGSTDVSLVVTDTRTSVKSQYPLCSFESRSRRFLPISSFSITLNRCKDSNPVF